MMKWTLAALTILAAVMATPQQAQAQHFCFTCDYSLIVPCTGSDNEMGAEQCATQAPDDCDLYGAVCNPNFAAWLPDGSGTGVDVDRLLANVSLAVMSGGELRTKTVRNCNGQVLMQIVAGEEAERLRARTETIEI